MFDNLHFRHFLVSVNFSDEGIWYSIERLLFYQLQTIACEGRYNVALSEKREVH